MNSVFAVSVPGVEASVLEKRILESGKSRSAYILECIRAFGVTDKMNEVINSLVDAEHAETRALLAANLRRELLHPSPLVVPDAQAKQ